MIKNYLSFDGMCWPKPDTQLGDYSIEWLLRYGSEESIIEKRMVIASIVGAYDALIYKTQKKRNYICEKIKNE